MQGKLTLTILLVVAAATFALPHSGETFRMLRHANRDFQSASRYLFIGDGAGDLTYDNARRICPQLGIGGALAELETKQEEEDVINFFESNSITDTLIWVAGKWRGNNSYVWESGLPLRNDTPWRAGEPSLNGLDIRVAMGVNQNGIEMFTSDRDEQYYALCEYKDTQ